MTTVRAVVAAGALSLAALLGGCGGEEPSRFTDEVGAIEDSVRAGDRQAALAALQALRADIGAARAAGDLPPERLSALDALVYETGLLIDTLLPPPAPPTTTTPPPQPETDADREAREDGDDGDGDDEDDGPGNGRGNARGRDG